MIGTIVECTVKGQHPFFSGSASLSGTVKSAGNPAIPVQRQVVLFAELPSPKTNALRRKNLQYIAETISEADGSWQFDNLNPDYKYTVQAWDSTGIYAPVIGAGLTAA